MDVGGGERIWDRICRLSLGHLAASWGIDAAVWAHVRGRACSRVHGVSSCAGARTLLRKWSGSNTDGMCWRTPVDKASKGEMDYEVVGLVDANVRLRWLNVRI